MSFTFTPLPRRPPSTGTPSVSPRMDATAVEPRYGLVPLLKGWDALRDYDLEATTLWDFPAQSPEAAELGGHRFNGGTPASLAMNLVRRYSRPRDVVVSPTCGS